ncbi:MAG: hypothetical protein ACTSU5_00740 [Promethearchaeota archaeon]
MRCYRCPQCQELLPFSKRVECPRCGFVLEKYDTIPRMFPDLFRHPVTYQVILAVVLGVAKILIALEVPPPWYQYDIFFDYVLTVTQLFFFPSATRYYLNKIRVGILGLSDPTLVEHFHKVFVPAMRSRKFELCRISAQLAVWSLILWYFIPIWAHDDLFVYSFQTASKVHVAGNLVVTMYVASIILVTTFYSGHVTSLVITSIFLTRFLLFPTERRRKRAGLKTGPFSKDYKATIFQFVYDKRFTRLFLTYMFSFSVVLIAYDWTRWVLMRNEGAALQMLVGFLYAGGSVLFFAFYFHPLAASLEVRGLAFHVCNYAVFANLVHRGAGGLGGDTHDLVLLERNIVPFAPRTREIAPLLPEIRGKFTGKIVGRTTIEKLVGCLSNGRMGREIPVHSPESSGLRRTGHFKIFRFDLNFTEYYFTLGASGSLWFGLVSTRKPTSDEVASFVEVLASHEGDLLSRQDAENVRSAIQVKSRFCLSEGFVFTGSSIGGQQVHHAVRVAGYLQKLASINGEDSEFLEELLHYYEQLKEIEKKNEIRNGGSGSTR